MSKPSIVELWKRASGMAPQKAPEPPPTGSAPITAAPGSQPPRWQLDAMRLNGGSVRVRLQSLGLQAPDGIADRAPRDRLDPDLQAVLETVDAERAEAGAIRSAALAEGAIDARTATPAQIRERMTKLGLHDAAHSIMLDELDEERKSKPAPARQPTPQERHEYARSVAEEVVERVIIDAAKRGVPVNTKRFNGLELEVYLKKRGLAIR